MLSCASGDSVDLNRVNIIVGFYRPSWQISVENVSADAYLSGFLGRLGVSGRRMRYRYIDGSGADMGMCLGDAV